MLPFIDEHTLRIAAPRDVVWQALEKQVAASLRAAEKSLFARLLGTVPRAGFEVADRQPADRLTLTGRHRFARYQLGFELVERDDGATDLRAGTHAEFPGLRGRLYRALVIGTGAHVVATRQILRSVGRRAARLAAASLPGSGPQAAR